MLFHIVLCHESRSNNALHFAMLLKRNNIYHVQPIYRYIYIHLICTYFPLLYLKSFYVVFPCHTHTSHIASRLKCMFFPSPSIKAVTSKNCKACCQHVTSAQLDAKAENENKVRWRLWWPISWAMGVGRSPSWWVWSQMEHRFRPKLWSKERENGRR